MFRPEERLWVVPGAQPVMNVLLRWRGVGELVMSHVAMCIEVLLCSYCYVLVDFIIMKHLCRFLQLAAVERLALKACIEEMPACRVCRQKPSTLDRGAQRQLACYDRHL